MTIKTLFFNNFFVWKFLKKFHSSRIKRHFIAPLKILRDQTNVFLKQVVFSILYLYLLVSIYQSLTSPPKANKKIKKIKSNFCFSILDFNANPIFFLITDSKDAPSITDHFFLQKSLVSLDTYIIS